MPWKGCRGRGSLMFVQVNAERKRSPRLVYIAVRREWTKEKDRRAVYMLFPPLIPRECRGGALAACSVSFPVPPASPFSVSTPTSGKASAAEPRSPGQPHESVRTPDPPTRTPDLGNPFENTALFRPVAGREQRRALHHDRKVREPVPRAETPLKHRDTTARMLLGRTAAQSSTATHLPAAQHPQEKGLMKHQKHRSVPRMRAGTDHRRCTGRVPATPDEINRSCHAGQIILGGCFKRATEWQCTACGAEFFEHPASLADRT